MTSHNNNETASVKHNTVQVVPSGVNTWSCGIINLFGFNKCIGEVRLESVPYIPPPEAWPQRGALDDPDNLFLYSKIGVRLYWLKIVVNSAL